MKLNSVLCLLLLASNSQAAFWNKNGKEKDAAGRRRLAEVSTSAMDNDASTGTVKKVVSKEDKAAGTCDGQMALSLANANEAKINAETERDEIKIEKAAALEQVAALEKSLSEMEEVKRQLEAKMDEINAANEAKVKSIMDGLKSSTGDIVKEYEAKMSDLTKAHESAQASTAAKIQELEKTIEQNAKDAEEAKAEALENAEYFHSQEAAKLKNELVLQAEQAADALAKQKEAADAKLKEALAEKKKSIESHKAKARKAEQDAKDAEEELAMWRKTHENRTYCNYTYMTEDIYWVGGAAYNRSAELGSYAYEGASSIASKASAKSYEAYEASKPYMDQTHKVYEKNVKPHYDKHVKPQYEKNVKPLVAKGYETYEKKVLPKLKETKKSIDPKIVQLWEAYEKQFNKLARKYGAACTKGFKASSDLARKNNLKAFDNYIAPSWKASCDHPKDTLRGAQIAVMVALLLPYTFVFIRFALWLVFLPVRIVLSILLLPITIFMGKPKKKAAPAKKTANDVRVKQKKVKITTSQ